ncbi:MAG TPA: aspartate aminotransferase family protein [Candidatus Competibacter sp.]|nr:aspartate aminotransferase family protein [Candidatus Competibacter sp.]
MTRAPAAAPPPGESETNATPERAAWQAAHLDAAGQRLLAEDARYFLRQSVSTPCLAAIRRAEGCWIEDTAGRRYLDFHGNSAHHLGYGHPRLLAAIKTQLDELSFAPRRFTCEPAVELARRLTDLSPPGLDKVLFATGGSDAIEIALKIARAATGRFKTLSFWDAFHGAGFGAASVGGEALFRSGPIGPLLAGTEHLPPFACYRCPYGYAADAEGQPQLALCRLTCAQLVRYALEREGDVAAVIAEPARAVPTIPPPGFWRSVREACDAHGALLIFDEIPTGLGKTGRLFACEHDGVVPDILVLGKALGGGVLPLAATLCRAGLDVGQDWAFGHYTHEKNPVLARAALATLQIIEDENLVENARRQGERALARLRAMRQRHPLIGDVRGRGLLLGVELVTDRAAKTPARAAAEAVLYRSLARGLSFKISLGNVLTLSPPLIVGEREMDLALGILESAIAEVERGTAG